MDKSFAKDSNFSTFSASLYISMLLLVTANSSIMYRRLGPQRLISWPKLALKKKRVFFLNQALTECNTKIIVEHPRTLPKKT